MSIWLQKSASIQPRTSLPKFQAGVSFTLQFHIRTPPLSERPSSANAPFFARFERSKTAHIFSCMTPATAEEDRSPPRSENQGFRRNYFSFFGNPLTPNSSKFEISPKFCEAFFNPVKFRQIFIKICSKTREIDSKFAKNDEIWWKKLQK